MRETCTRCGMEKRIEEFEVISVNRRRGVCRDCRHRQRQQRRTSSSSLADTNEDTVSIVSQTCTYHHSMDGGGGESEHHLRAIDDDDGVDNMTPPPKSPAVAYRQLDARIRPLEEQLRALTDEHRQGGMPSIGQRLVQLEHEMQSLRGGNGCDCSARDPLWEIFVWLVWTTVVFGLLRLVEGRLWHRSPADSDDRSSLPN